MSSYRTSRPPEAQPSVDAAKLWTGGAATAVVAGGVAVVGFMVVRGLLQIPVLGVDLSGGVVLPSMFAYAAWAAVAALIVTGVMHLILLTTLPRPRVFLGWIGSVAIAIAAIAPLTVAAPVEERLATAAINLVIGVVIIGLLSVSAAGSARP